MNSTIQQLYMVPSFRKAILEVEDRTPATTPKEDNILYQLKVQLILSYNYVTYNYCLVYLCRSR